jgi:hypothetical protein
MNAPCQSGPPLLEELQRRFLSVLPHVTAYGRHCFRSVRCPQRRDDQVAEMVALAWKWFVRMAARGKDGREFPGSIAIFAARAVRCGRKLCRQEKTKDVFSAVAQGRHDFMVSARFHTQAAFRIDFPAWLKTLGQRNRAIAEDMAMGHGTRELATKYGVCAGRISQMRREFHGAWLAFHAEPVAC